jgi:hypothetical protein
MIRVAFSVRSHLKIFASWFCDVWASLVFSVAGALRAQLLRVRAFYSFTQEVRVMGLRGEPCGCFSTTGPTATSTARVGCRSSRSQAGARHGLAQAISREGVGVNERAMLDAVNAPVSVETRANDTTRLLEKTQLLS